MSGKRSPSTEREYADRVAEPAIPCVFRQSSAGSRRLPCRAGTTGGTLAATGGTGVTYNYLRPIDHGDRAEYAGLVDRVVYPEELAAHAATNEIVHVAGGGVRTIEEVSGDLTLLELTVAGDAPVAGRELREVAFPRGAVVVAGRDSNQLPGPEMVLEPGFRYVVAVKTDISDEVVRLFRG